MHEKIIKSKSGFEMFICSKPSYIKAVEPYLHKRMIADSIAKLSASASARVSSVEELLFLDIHSVLLSSPEFELTCVYEQTSSVPGFSPSLKDVPNNKLVWEGWNQDISAISSIYKCKRQPGKLFVLNCISMDPHVTLVSFSDKATNGETSTLEIDSSEYIDANAVSIRTQQGTVPIELKSGSSSIEDIKNLFLNQEGLINLIKQLISKVIKAVVTPSPLQSSSSSSSYSSSSSVTAPTPYPSYVPPPDAGRGGGLVPPQRVPVGDGDLNPFPLFIPSVPQPSYGSGSLVGPDHPIFGQNGPNGSGGSTFPPNIPGLPQPRFDPFYPEVPGEIGPDIAGVPGGIFPRRGRGNGRGNGGRGGRFGRVPGEPNPDHLRPPGFGGEDPYM